MQLAVEQSNAGQDGVNAPVLPTMPLPEPASESLSLIERTTFAFVVIMIAARSLVAGSARRSSWRSSEALLP